MQFIGSNCIGGGEFSKVTQIRFDKYDNFDRKTLLFDMFVCGID